MVLESNRAMFESNLRCDSNSDWIESPFDFAHHWSKVANFPTPCT